MNKILVIVSCLLLLFCFQQVILSQTTKEQFVSLQSDIRNYVGDIDMLIGFHEDGVSKSYTTTRGNTFSLTDLPTAGEKVALRNEMKAALDSIIVKANTMKTLLP